MRAKLSYLSFLLFLLMLLHIGCTSTESPSIPEPPASPVIQIGSDDHEVTISWLDSPSSVDGYYIRFEGDVVGDVPSTQTYFTHRPPYLGTYSISAYKDGSESQARSIDLPGTFEDSTSISPLYYCAFRIDTFLAYSMRYVIRHEGQFGDSTNEQYADTIDFYIDNEFWLHSPKTIVDEGRWSDAFHTKFHRIASGTPVEVVDTITTLPQYSDTLYSDSVFVGEEGTLVSIVAFRDNPPAASSDKIYALFYTRSINPDTTELKVNFTIKMQTHKNFRLLRSEP